jgi:hypothetical protein
MHRRLHTLLLILVTLCVALTPLRSAWALPETAAPDTASHCADMQHDMQQMDHDAGHGGKSGGNTHDCKFGCNGSCCDKSCSACLHAPVAIPACLIVLRDKPDHEHRSAIIDAFPDLHPKPPLRPPLAFPG